MELATPWGLRPDDFRAARGRDSLSFVNLAPSLVYPVERVPMSFPTKVMAVAIPVGLLRVSAYRTIFYHGAIPDFFLPKWSLPHPILMGFDSLILGWKPLFPSDTPFDYKGSPRSVFSFVRSVID